MGGCPGTMSGSRPRPANPHDRDRDRDTKPRDSRDRDENLRDSSATKISRDNKSRHLRTRIPVSPGTVPLSQDSMWRKSRSVSQSLDSIWRIYLIVYSFDTDFNIFETTRKLSTSFSILILWRIFFMNCQFCVNRRKALYNKRLKFFFTCIA